MASLPFKGSESSASLLLPSTGSPAELDARELASTANGPSPFDDEHRVTQPASKSVHQSKSLTNGRAASHSNASLNFEKLSNANWSSGQSLLPQSHHRPAIRSPLIIASRADTNSRSSSCSDSSAASPRETSPVRTPFDRAGVPNQPASRPYLNPLPRFQTTRSGEMVPVPPTASSLSLRSTAPMTVRDLGSDFNRYYSPFSDSRRSSMTDLSSSTPQPRLSGASVLSLGNPFESQAGSTTYLLTNDTTETFSPFLDDRLAAPFGGHGGYRFPLFMDEKEPDDDMHMPAHDDDARFAPTWKERLKGQQLASTLGLALMIFGLLFLFIGLPILTHSGWKILESSYSTPIEEMGGPFGAFQEWAHVNDEKYPLLKNMRTGLIDPMTPKSAMKRKSIKGDDLKLVYSDEFNDNNRTFYPGDDPYWFAGDFWYGATRDIAWYDPDAATTWDGTLELRLDAFMNHGLNYRSGMLNSWNQLCFKGGVFEVSVSLPGPGGVSGLWPGAWTMGNLGRPGYLSTTDGMWPYTYDECDYGITPNQSMVDGTSFLPGMKLPSCTCKGEDHPNPGSGRGAPEIDILEGTAWGGMPVVTQSFQIAPFDVYWYPDYEFTEFPDYTTSFPNTWTGGPFQQAVSASSTVNTNWFDGMQYQKYAFEYEPGTGEDGFIAWYVGDGLTFFMDGRSIGPNGNVKARMVAEEPLTMILNLGLSNNWVGIDWANLVFPSIYRVDYVRWYQREGEEMVTCDPPGYETTDYIKNHMDAYTNPNYTTWPETGYEWPRNTFMHDCS